MPCRSLGCTSSISQTGAYTSTGRCKGGGTTRGKGFGLKCAASEGVAIERCEYRECGRRWEVLCVRRACPLSTFACCSCGRCSLIGGHLSPTCMHLYKTKPQSSYVTHQLTIIIITYYASAYHQAVLNDTVQHPNDILIVVHSRILKRTRHRMTHMQMKKRNTPLMKFEVITLQLR